MQFIGEINQRVVWTLAGEK